MLQGYEDFFSSILPEDINSQQNSFQSSNALSLSSASGSPTDPKVGSKRANQNLACRNYRKKKKEYTQSLESRISDLEEENKRLRQLCQNPAVSSITPEDATVVQQLRQVFDQLEEALRQGDEKSLTYLLQIFSFTLERYSVVYEKEIEKLVNPSTQANLARMGYIADACETFLVTEPETILGASFRWDSNLGRPEREAGSLAPKIFRPGYRVAERKSDLR